MSSSKTVPSKTVHIVWVDASKYPSKLPEGWTLREVPYWLLGIDPGVLFKQCMVRPDGVIIACRSS